MLDQWVLEIGGYFCVLLVGYLFYILGFQGVNIGVMKYWVFVFIFGYGVNGNVNGYQLFYQFYILIFYVYLKR